MDEAPKNKNITQQFFGNVYAEITFIKDLVFRTDFGINHRNFRGRMFAPKFFHSAECKEDNSRVEQSTNANSSWQWENTLRYKKSFGEHSTSVLLGTSASRDVYEFMTGTRNKYPNEAMTNENYETGSFFFNPNNSPQISEPLRFLNSAASSCTTA